MGMTQLMAQVQLLPSSKELDRPFVPPPEYEIAVEFRKAGRHLRQRTIAEVRVDAQRRMSRSDVEPVEQQEQASGFSA